MIGFSWNLFAEEQVPFQISGYGDVEYFTSSNPDLFEEYRIRNFVLDLEHSREERFTLKARLYFEDAPYIIGNLHKKDEQSSTGGSLKLENLSIEGRDFSFFSFEAGRFFLPVGIWNVDELRNLSTQIDPLHIDKIFPNILDGLQVLGEFPFSGVKLKTHLFHGNGEGNRGGRDDNREKAWGYRTTFHFPLGKGFTLGNTQFTDAKNAVSDYKKTAKGYDLRFDFWKVRLQMEYSTARLEYKGINIGTVDFNRKGNYYQVGFFHKDLSTYFRSDYYDPNSENRIDAVITTTLALNYQLSLDVIAKLEHHIIDLEDTNSEDYEISILSLSAFFGK